MKYILLLSIILFSACHKEAGPTMSEGIKGNWEQTFAPHSKFSFDGYRCIQRTYLGSTEVFRNEYAYTTTADTMILTDFEDESEHKWVVNVTGYSEAQITTETGFLIGLVRF